MSTALLYNVMLSVHMAVNESHATGGPAASPTQMTEDRYCRHCTEIALAYDPSANKARCRSCGELAT